MRALMKTQRGPGWRMRGNIVEQFDARGIEAEVENFLVAVGQVKAILDADFSHAGLPRRQVPFGVTATETDLPLLAVPGKGASLGATCACHDTPLLR